MARERKDMAGERTSSVDAADAEVVRGSGQNNTNDGPIGSGGGGNRDLNESSEDRLETQITALLNRIEALESRHNVNQDRVAQLEAELVRLRNQLRQLGARR